jgi:hypothetical protein
MGDNPETNVVNSFGFAHEVLTSACSAPRRWAPVVRTIPYWHNPILTAQALD